MSGALAAIRNSADLDDGLIDRSSTESLHPPRDRHGRCLLLHSCDLRHYISNLHAGYAPDGTSSDGKSVLPLPSKHWKSSAVIYSDPANALNTIEEAPWSNWIPVPEFGQDDIMAAAKQSALHLADHAGFDSVLSSALAVLADVMCRHVQDLCRSMGQLADTQPKHTIYSWDLLRAVLDKRSLRNADALALEKYWVQNIWNVAVLRQRTAVQLRRALSREKPADGSAAVPSGCATLSGDSTPASQTHQVSSLTSSRRSTPGSLLLMTAQNGDSFPPTMKISTAQGNSISSASTPTRGGGSSDVELSISSPYDSPPTASLFAPSSSSRFSPMLESPLRPTLSFTPPPPSPSFANNSSPLPPLTVDSDTSATKLTPSPKGAGDARTTSGSAEKRSAGSPHLPQRTPAKRKRKRSVA